MPNNDCSPAVSQEPVGLELIPRAEAAIARSIRTLRTVEFAQDPLFDAADSFALSLRSSAIKREGGILEAAFMDAIEQTKGLRLLTPSRRLKRVPDVLFEWCGQLVALELKRGVQHDSTKLRAFRADLREIPELMRTALPLFPLAAVHFHIVFITGSPPLREGLTPAQLRPLYGLDVRRHVQTARQYFSAAIKSVLRERTP